MVDCVCVWLISDLRGKEESSTCTSVYPLPSPVPCREETHCALLVELKKILILSKNLVWLLNFNRDMKMNFIISFMNKNFSSYRLFLFLFCNILIVF